MKNSAFQNNIKSAKKEKLSQHIIHPFEPFYDKNSNILILGSFPSVASRADGFYYGNIHNRFWKVLAAVFKNKDCFTNSKISNSDFDDDIKLITTQDKKDFLSCHKIALYDAIKECTISGSSDNSIRKVVPSNIEQIVQSSNIKKIFVNGKTAEKFFLKYQPSKLCKILKVLPSTSPANAKFSLEKLIQEWKVVAED